MIRIDLKLPIDYTADIIKEKTAEYIPIKPSEITGLNLLRRTLDLSGSEPCYKCSVALEVGEDREAGLLKIRNKVFSYTERVFSAEITQLSSRPVVVGAGPAGLFCALALAEAGTRPIILERGLPVEQRAEKIRIFNTLGIIDTECNVQYGEGGAGTYSDGKLKVGSMDEYKRRVIKEFILSGATDDIAYSSTAHLGTDRLPAIIRSLRERIISLGGEFFFGAKLTDIEISDKKIRSVKYESEGVAHELATDYLVLATGHSARDTITMLYNKGLKMTPKGFGVGVRVEHPREYTNKMVYKSAYGKIPDTASYHLVTHLKNGRSVYSFCMCPGGSVVAAANEEGGIVTNGMSRFDRMADNSNAAILVSITPEDFGSEHALAGLEFQRRIERRAYSLTDNYRAPSQLMGDFLANTPSTSLGNTAPSYERGVDLIPLREYLPDYITESLREGIYDFDRWMEGFNYHDAVLTGPETRTTSPVRIERTERGEALGFIGIYPIGEGAGYAGGIVSSATDGLRAAEKILSMK